MAQAHNQNQNPSFLTNTVFFSIPGNLNAAQKVKL